MQKEYTEEFKENILKKLENGEKISHLSKEFSVSKKILNRWQEELDKRVRASLITCNKKYKTYKAYIEKKIGTPYDSKIGGIPYIDEAKGWKVCPNCSASMVLALQLNIKTLPETPKGLEEWDFIQVYTCMNPKGTKECFQIAGYFCNECEEMKSFNRSFQIELINKKSSAIELEKPLWFDGYELEYNKEYKEKLHAYSSEKVIVSWGQKEEISCVDGYYSWWSIHSNDYYSSKKLDVCTTREHTDLFGLISTNELENRALNVVDSYPYCICCSKPMTLLYQFVWTREEFGLHSEIIGSGEYENVYALFYCLEHPELMSCQWVSVYK